MRRGLAIFMGALVGSIVFFLIGMLANMINPTPAELMDPTTPEAVAERVAATSAYTWLTTIFGLAAGSFFGGLLGARIAMDKVFSVTTGIGLILALWAGYTFYVVYPASLWVPLAMLVSAFVFSYLGGLVYIKISKKEI